MLKINSAVDAAADTILNGDPDSSPFWAAIAEEFGDAKVQDLPALPIARLRDGLKYTFRQAAHSWVYYNVLNDEEGTDG